MSKWAVLGVVLAVVVVAVLLALSIRVVKKRAMAKQAEAEREKRAKIISAQGESLAAAATRPAPRDTNHRGGSGFRRPPPSDDREEHR